MLFCQSGYALALLPGQIGVACGLPQDAHRINPSICTAGKHMAEPLFIHAAGGYWG